MSSESTSVDTLPSSEPDEGPGCLPAVLAVLALLLMVGFIFCGVSTWYLFQQRTELARRALEGSVIPEIEQSGLEPEEKRAVIQVLQGVVEEAAAGQLENWQASGVMERLHRSPILQWGDLQIVEALIANSNEFTADEKQDAQLQFSRLRRAAELTRIISDDFSDVLRPVHTQPDPAQRPVVNRGASKEQLADVVHRAKLVADRSEIPQQQFDVSLAEMIQREVNQGKQVGGL